LVDEGRTEIGGDIAVNASGGLLSMGEPVGAVGVAQVCEVVTQLRGRAGLRQVPDAKVGMCESAGAGGSCNVIILKR
jgi:acetyl-CoA acetyltransferase